MSQTSSAVLALAVAACSASAQAETIYGIAGSSAAALSLVRFDSATPGATTTIGAITGIVAGQQLRAVDFRASDGQLYGVSTTSTGANAQLYTLDLATGAATAVGTGFGLAGNTTAGVTIDFNPVANALRLVTQGDQSYRINANTGTVIAQDTSITPGTVQISSLAYTNNVAGATQTTLYAYDFSGDTLGTIGGINSVPSPNGGVYTSVGGSGIVTSNASAAGFDISGATGMAFASTDMASGDSEPEFYSVNLSTGSFTQLGDFATGMFLRDFSVLVPAVSPVPESSTMALTLLGLVGLGAAARRRAAGRG